MRVKKFNNTYMIRIDKGEEVIESLKKICRDEKIQFASISGIGAADKVTLGLYNVPEKKYYSKELEGAYEITSLLGNVTEMNGEVYLHIHATISNKDLNVFGGHMNYCRIGATSEIVITLIDGKMGRVTDEETGLNILDI